MRNWGLAMTHLHRNDDWAQPIKRNGDPRFYDAQSDENHRLLTSCVHLAIGLLVLGIALWMW